MNIKAIFRSTIAYKAYSYNTTKADKFVEKREAFSGVSVSELSRIKRKMKYGQILFDISFNDFFQCRCDQLSLFEMGKIVPYKQQKNLWKQINSKEAHDLLCDKWRTYLFFNEYFKRDIVLVTKDKEDDERFDCFVSRHPRFIVKPVGLNCGKGIQIVDASCEEHIKSQLLKQYADGFVAEELIVQADSLSSFHPSSVNTLRINTVNYGDSIEVKWPCLRIGRCGSIVDNAGAGGVFGAIDVDTGRVVAASDEFHHSFEMHPDTGLPLVGFVIPNWEEACDMAKKLALMIPDCRFVGWDLALTEKGWMMVEGNFGPLLIYQIAKGKGIKKDFKTMKKRLLRK